MKLKITNRGMMNRFLKLGKDNLYCEYIEEVLESRNENPWTLRLNFKIF